MAYAVARRAEGLLTTIPFHPLLFAGYPVLLLYAENVNEVPATDVVGPLAALVTAGATAYLLLAALTRHPRMSAIVVSAFVLAVFDFGYLREVVEPWWHGSTSALAIAALAGVALVSGLSIVGRDRLTSLTAALNVVSVVLVMLAVWPIAAYVVTERGRPSSLPPIAAQRPAAAARPEGAAGHSPAPLRDIYHLVLDRYGSRASLATGFDHSSAAFVAWLRAHGFQVVEDARANYVRTVLSLGATLGMEHLDRLAARLGPAASTYEPVVERIRRSPAAAYLQARGYRYVHVGSWFPETRTSRIADLVLAPEATADFPAAVYELSVLPVILDGRSTPWTVHARSAEAQFEALASLADDPGPTYVFAHILLPHPPYVYLADGTEDPSHATFRSQLRYTDRRVRRILEPLLARPEHERPIIILQADEGPYPLRYDEDVEGFAWESATGDELVTKFGVLMAFHLPGPEGAAELPATMSLVNTYPEILRRYLGAPLEARPDRSYASPPGAPYAFVDVTAALDARLAARAATAGHTGRARTTAAPADARTLSGDAGAGAFAGSR